MNKDELVRILTSVRAREKNISWSNFTTLTGPSDKFHFENRADGPTEFYLYNMIGGYDGISSAEVAAALAGVSGDISLRINSAGGSIFEGSAIFNLFNNYNRGTVISYIDGVAASAASWVAQAGEQVLIERNATMMIHDGSGGVIGTAKDMREQADVLDMLSDVMAETYARKTGVPAKTWRNIMKSGDKWYNAQEAVKAKLASGIAGDTDPDNSFDVGIFKALLGTTATTDPATTDVEGIRNALKGAFA